LIGFFEQGMLQLCDSDLLLVDRVIRRGRETLEFDAI
jgi:hypothetical protein